MSAGRDVVEEVVDAALAAVRNRHDRAVDKVAACLLVGLLEIGRTSVQSSQRSIAAGLISGSGRASFVGTGQSGSTESVAAGHAYLMHANLRDDSYRTAFHPGQLIIPTALALGQEGRCSGREVFDAVWFGYEVACRLADILLPEASDNGWRITSVLAPFASASTAACLLDPRRRVLISAVRLASATAGGSLHVVQAGSDWKIQPALSLGAGVLAGRAAAHGYEAGVRPLEAHFGILKMFSGKPVEAQKHWTDPAPRLSQVTFKKYEAPMYAQGLLDACSNLESPTSAPAVWLRVSVSPFTSNYAGAGQSPASVGNIASTLFAHLAQLPVALQQLTEESIEVCYDQGISELQGRIEVRYADGRTRHTSGTGDTSRWAVEDVVEFYGNSIPDSADALARAVLALPQEETLDELMIAWRAAVQEWSTGSGRGASMKSQSVGTSV